nr:SonH [Paraconiothyrium archidendri]
MTEVDIPNPPFVPISGLANARDIGGYPIASSSGKIVKRGLVFRASEPSKATDEGVAKLQELNIKVVYDLRSAEEIEHDGRKIREWPGITRVHAPIFSDQAHDPQLLAARSKSYNDNPKGFVFGYQQDILKSASSADNKAQPFKQILEHLASSSPSPILLHDAAGKDRTGVVCALALSLCGVDDEVVAHEYSLTDLGLRSRHLEFLTGILDQYTITVDAHTARRMNASKKQTMVDLLAWIKEQWGSVEDCVISLGLLDVNGIESLRQNLTVDGSAIDWQAHAGLVEKAVVEADELADKIQRQRSAAK